MAELEAIGVGERVGSVGVTASARIEGRGLAGSHQGRHSERLEIETHDEHLPNCVEKAARDARYRCCRQRKDLPSIAGAMDVFIDQQETAWGSSRSRLCAMAVDSIENIPRCPASDDDGIEASKGEGILGALIITASVANVAQQGMVVGENLQIDLAGQIYLGDNQ